MKQIYFRDFDDDALQASPFSQKGFFRSLPPDDARETRRYLRRRLKREDALSEAAGKLW